MVETSIVDGVLVLWTPAYLWPAALAGNSLARRRRVALERLAAVVADETGLADDHAMRCAAAILGHVAEA